ncbi:hypothetical protein ABZ953_16930 [Streptomyces sp. NPDC046465]|uniref:hypothetical protein n=1 Tax=Streptomyces sp. NPDC046465 TaxID=3155810 RepID=UPI0033E4555D
MTEAEAQADALRERLAWARELSAELRRASRALVVENHQLIDENFRLRRLVAAQGRDGSGGGAGGHRGRVQ